MTHQYNGTQWHDVDSIKPFTPIGAHHILRSDRSDTPGWYFLGYLNKEKVFGPFETSEEARVAYIDYVDTKHTPALQEMLL